MNEVDLELGDASQLERGREILEKAIEALSHLYSGNALLERSVAYLRQLLHLVEEWGIAPLPVEPKHLLTI